MKKIYCNNCKHFNERCKLLDSGTISFEYIKNGSKIKKYFKGISSANNDNNCCKYYKRKWWKIWIK